MGFAAPNPSYRLAPMITLPGAKSGEELMVAASKEAKGVIIARLEGSNKNPAAGVGVLLALGLIAMILEIIFEDSAIRLAAWGTIWTGWNVLCGIPLLNGRRTDYVVFRELPPD